MSSSDDDAPPPAKKPCTEVVQSAISAVAAVIGGRVSQCLDTESPRHATYSVTSKPLRYVGQDNGEPLHDAPVTESFQFTVTMHPDLSVEGTMTMEEHAASMNNTVTFVNCCEHEETHRVDERFPFRANAFFSASDEAVVATMHYDTGLAIAQVKNRKFEHVDDLQDRAEYVALKTKKLKAALAASTVCTMMFGHSCEHSSDPFEERAQVTIFKNPFRIDVSHWSRGTHCFSGGDRAAPVNFEVDTIELVQGVAVSAPVFS